MSVLIKGMEMPLYATPHGRLIDADALRKTIESIYGGALWTFDCFECIRKAPTVIEAEVSEE